jgi:4-diphosphocytidyl-2-C-methyl-D-erythritol kinase
MQAIWQEPARAKVNLFLHVTGKRADGYHLLDSLAVFPQVSDVLSAEPADTFSLVLSGRFGATLAAEPDNLVLRAACALAARCGVAAGARLLLEKNLPIASGIGGGSADAAAALRLLCRMWKVDPGPNALAEIAAALGADVPVCLRSQPARMQGIGEMLSDAPVLPDCGMVLVNPGVAVATPAIFRARSGAFSPTAILPRGWDNAATLAADLATQSNDLEPPALSLCPVIGDVLAALRADPACLLARMSGSGATCFALYATPAIAEAAASRLADRAWWVWGGAMAASQTISTMGLPEPGARP